MYCFSTCQTPLAAQSISSSMKSRSIRILITMDQAHQLRPGSVRTLGIDVKLDNFPRLHRDLVRVTKELDLCHVQIPISAFSGGRTLTDAVPRSSTANFDQARRFPRLSTCAAFPSPRIFHLSVPIGNGPGLTNTFRRHWPKAGKYHFRNY